MPDYIFTFEGEEQKRRRVSYPTLEDARNEAVRYLGAYLSTHPGFANEGHWRVNVEDSCGQTLLHVIVATVTARQDVARDWSTGSAEAPSKSH